MSKALNNWSYLAWVIVLLTITACAQQKPADEEAATESLQKATQNPVASLISVPLQNNTVTISSCKQPGAT